MQLHGKNVQHNLSRGTFGGPADLPINESPLNQDQGPGDVAENHVPQSPNAAPSRLLSHPENLPRQPQGRILRGCVNQRGWFLSFWGPTAAKQEEWDEAKRNAPRFRLFLSDGQSAGQAGLPAWLRKRLANAQLDPAAVAGTLADQRQKAEKATGYCCSSRSAWRWQGLCLNDTASRFGRATP